MEEKVTISSLLILIIIILIIWIGYFVNLYDSTNALIITVSTLIGGLAGGWVLEYKKNSKEN